MDAVQSMNGTIWVFAALLIGLVVVQALLFLRLALRYNRQEGVLTKEEVKFATRTGIIAGIGPSFGTLPVVLSLIVLVGSATTFMRCGVIGAAPFELMMASLTAQAVGVEFGSTEFTQSVFTLCLFGMAWASAPYFLNTILTLKPLDKAVSSGNKSTKRSFVPYISTGAMLAILVNLLMDKFTSVAGVAAAIGAGLVTVGMQNAVKKTGNKTLGSFTIAIAMVCAMIIGQVITVLMA